MLLLLLLLWTQQILMSTKMRKIRCVPTHLLGDASCGITSYWTKGTRWAVGQIWAGWVGRVLGQVC
jgi:hypothetical protein